MGPEKEMIGKICALNLSRISTWSLIGYFDQIIVRANKISSLFVSLFE